VARALSPNSLPARALTGLVESELWREVPLGVAVFAERLAARAGGAVAAVLFYGSALRDGVSDGLLDFYVLVDSANAWPGSRLAAAANWMLPPNVGYAEDEIDGQVLRAKYAVMTLARFRRGMAPRALDTTLWARFSQPCACVYARSDADRNNALGAVCDAVITAGYWMAMLGPEQGEPLAYWNALYARTYGLELRVESETRSSSLVDRAPERYARLLPASWHAAGIAFEAQCTTLRPIVEQRVRARAQRAWRRRHRLGRPLNVLRLLKAAFTFDAALDYVVWKVERHSGVRLTVAPWERRFPILAAPGLYRRLRRRGVLR
jgi:hypothetical protein